jgi:3-methyl-2-oxobutanoate hydroxymethyltransferase
MSIHVNQHTCEKMSTRRPSDRSFGSSLSSSTSLPLAASIANLKERIEAMAREGIPVVGHIGMVPRHVTWTGYRSLGKTVDEAKAIYQKMKDLENAGAYAAEIEIVPHNLASWLCKQTTMLLMSLGSGSGCDTQFLFSCDILGDYDERIPRHAKSYRNFTEEYRRLQNERIAAFSEYVADVKENRFPEREHLTEMDAALLDELKRSVP